MDRRAFMTSLAVSAAGCVLPKAAAAQGSSQALGLRFLPKAEFGLIKKATNTRASLPAVASVKSLAPPVGSQGNQGSCVGWSVGYGLASSLLKRRGSGVHASPSFIYDRGRLVDGAANGWEVNCLSGMFIETALSYLQGFGVLPIDDFPYSDASCSRLPTVVEDKSARKMRVISDWSAARDLDAVKGSIAAGLPALLGMTVRDSFFSLEANAIYRSDNSREAGGHAMLVVGYDDNRGAIEIMNSWSNSWANAGFGWISYQAISRDAYVDGELRMYTVTLL